MPISPAAITSAIKTVTNEITLNDGANGRGGGSLLLVVRRLNDGGTSAQWFARWIRDGKRSKKQIGRYPDITLAMARQMMAAEMSPLIKSGKTVKVAAPEDNVKPTVENMFKAYVQSMRDKNRASANEVERQLLLAKDNAADALGRHQLASSIEDDDVVEYVASFYDRGHRGAADKVRSYLSSAYSWARKSTNDYTRKDRKNWGVKYNPAADVPRDAGAIKERTRNLDADELALLWKGIKGNGFSQEVRGCIAALICCGQRVQETLRMHGSEIDLDAKMWTIPKGKTKTKKREHKVPLPDLVIEALRPLKAHYKDGPLFPGRSGSKLTYINHRSIGQAIDRWNEDGIVAQFQTRDLRRTWKSRAHDAGIDRFTRDLIQQHAKHDTGSKNYDLAVYVPQMREAMDKWQAWLLGIGFE